MLARDHLPAVLPHECGCRPKGIAYLIDSYCNGEETKTDIRLGLKSVTGRWAVTVQRLGETEVS